MVDYNTGLLSEISDQVSPDVLNALLEGQPQELLVLFDSNEITNEVESFITQEDLTGDSDSVLNYKADLFTELKSETFSTVSEDFQILNDYENLPISFVEFESIDPLIELIQNENVLQVEVPQTYQISLSESLPLIEQPAAEAAGYTGAGTTVAVLDTGADPNAPGLQGRVVFAQDFAPDDGVSDDNGHGTNVSAIAAGVAPETQIAALDVFHFQPVYENGAIKIRNLASNSNIIAAIDWVIDKQNTYNIEAINMSLGSGKYTSSLADNNSTFGVAIAEAKSAGILSLVASGNNGFTDGISTPAAYESAVSVGAVYDYTGFYGSDLAEADKVAIFSNSASFLDIQAPGAWITAGGLTMAGTSMAAPHVAGAVAVLSEAFPNESPDQILERLTNTGDPITDHRNGITIPRLNLAAALELEDSTTIYPVGLASAYPPYSNSSSLDNDDTDDVYSFGLGGISSINLNLHNITSHDDADLYLYEDDGDGVFELSQDQELANSRLGGNADDSINYLAEAGDYFARVERYAPGSVDSLDYELDLSATPTSPYPPDDTGQAPNLLPHEFDLGTVSSDYRSVNQLGRENTVDTYSLSVSPGSELNFYLTEHTNDVDLRLVQDSNGNQIADSGEVIDYSVAGGNEIEQIELTGISGNFFLQVYMYGDGDPTISSYTDTDYRLTIINADLIDEYLTGDWDGDDIDELAVREGNAVYMDYDDDGISDFTQYYGNGNAEDEYLVGDWDGDGYDNLAVRRGNEVLMDDDFDGSHDTRQAYGWGNAEDEYLVGDWNGDGRDNLAVRRGYEVLMDNNFDGYHDTLIEYGRGSREDEYLVGDWNNDGYDNLAVRRGYEVLMDFGDGVNHELTHDYGMGNNEDQYLVGNWDGIDGDHLGVRRGDLALLAEDLDGLHDATRLFPI